MWYTAEIRQAKHRWRRSERLGRKTRFPIHRDIFRERRGEINDLIRESKTDYYAKSICDNKYDSKKLFNVVNTLLDRKQSMPLPRLSQQLMSYHLQEPFQSA